MISGASGDTDQQDQFLFKIKLTFKESFSHGAFVLLDRLDNPEKFLAKLPELPISDGINFNSSFSKRLVEKSTVTSPCPRSGTYSKILIVNRVHFRSLLKWHSLYLSFTLQTLTWSKTCRCSQVKSDSSLSL